VNQGWIFARIGIGDGEEGIDKVEIWSSEESDEQLARLPYGDVLDPRGIGELVDDVGGWLRSVPSVRDVNPLRRGGKSKTRQEKWYLDDHIDSTFSACWQREERQLNLR
jgi:hypothetical protein